LAHHVVVELSPLAARNETAQTVEFIKIPGPPAHVSEWRLQDPMGGGGLQG
jgi:hypothetical protein